MRHDDVGLSEVPSASTLPTASAAAGSAERSADVGTGAGRGMGAAATAFYSHAAETGRLPDPATTNTQQSTSISTSTTTTMTVAATALALTMAAPKRALLLEAAWATLVALAFSRGAGRARFSVPDEVTDAAGMSLFILLAFLVAEATARARAAAEQLHAVAHALRHVARKLLLDYPPDTWRPPDEGDGDRDEDAGGDGRHKSTNPSKNKSMSMSMSMSMSRDEDREGEGEVPGVNRHARALAHVAAYPAALALSLGAGGTDRARWLAPLLSAADVSAVLAAHRPHLRCSAVVRAHFAAAEDDSPRNFPLVGAARTPSGIGVRSQVIVLVDAVDASAATLLRVAGFYPAHGYVNHLRIFLIIWAAFVPLSLVAQSAWFTPLWATLVAYSVATVFTVAHSLAAPFAGSLVSVPVTRVCARFVADILEDIRNAASYTKAIPPALQETAGAGTGAGTGAGSTEAPSEMPSEERREAEKGLRTKTRTRTRTRTTTARTTSWLDAPLPRDVAGYAPRRADDLHPLRVALRVVLRTSRSVLLSLLAFTLWSAFIVFLTWGLSRNREPSPRDPGDRWWSVHIPISNSTLAYFSIAMFLLLSFWTTDSFARYFRALQIWRVRARANIETVAHVAVLMMPQGFWHERDHQRLLSYLAALPVAMRLYLRGSRDVTPLRELIGDDEDVQALVEDERPFPVHCADVVMAYLDSADAVDEKVVKERTRPFLVTAFTLQAAFWNADRALWESVAMNAAPIAPAFTLHLKIFVAVWLTLLPFTVVQFSGFVSFVFLIPIAYSVINLVHIADEVQQPFKCDEQDVPLEQFCTDIRHSIHRIYHHTREGTRGIVPQHESYQRKDFHPRLITRRKSSNNDIRFERQESKIRRRHLKRPMIPSWTELFKGNNTLSPLMTDELPVVQEREVRPTLVKTLRSSLSRLPTISWRAYILVTLWSVAAVYISWGLSTLWDGEDRGTCRAWCSPIDVEGAVLANVGFALFLIMSFRASEALARFDNGANMLYQLAMRARDFAVEFSLVFESGFFHPGDKERVVAHVAQVPLCLRDMLRGNGFGRESAAEGLLSDADRDRFVSSVSPIEHLLESLQAYVLAQDSFLRRGWDDLPEFRASPGMAAPLLAHLMEIRNIVAQTTMLKQFASVPMHRSLDSLFAFVWLAMLPLSMTSDLGFFTILWAPLISYGVLALRDVAAQLEEPFGCDVGDLPVDTLCAWAVDAVLEGVQATGWDTGRLCTEPADGPSALCTAALGPTLRGKQVSAKSFPPQLMGNPGSHDMDVDTDMDKPLELGFAERSLQRTRASLFTHLLCSTPWRGVAASFLWAIVACAIEKVTTQASEGGSDGASWWSSTVTITVSVVNGASFGAFLLLGFFVAAANARYGRGAAVWEAEVRPACHALASALLMFVRDGLVHRGDLRRLVGLVAAFPLLLKAELRGSRDARDAAALLAPLDLARASCAASMPAYCVDAIRAYVIRVVSHASLLHGQDVAPPRVRTAFVRFPLAALQNAAVQAHFLTTFGIAPVFKILLKTLLLIFLAIVPFVLFELSGWFTLLWTPLIAFGILGMYNIAIELQNPFGGDLNDVDIDCISHATVRDVLKVYSEQREQHILLMEHAEPPSSWTAKRTQGIENVHEDPVKVQPPTGTSRFWHGARLAMLAVPMWQLALLVLWSGFCVVLSIVVAKRLDLARCEGQQFCQFAIIDEDIKNYIGFAVFFLIGFVVNDAHARFVMAQSVWQEGIVGTSHVLTNRLLQSFEPGSFHEGDVERMCGHVAAMPIVLALSLRRNSHAKCSMTQSLRRVVGEDDARRIEDATDSVSYCLDVVRDYLFFSERLEATEPKRNGIPTQEQFNCLLYVDALQSAAFQCLQISRVEFPFGYFAHVRVFLAVWLALLPIGLVETSGWFTMLWVVLIGYGLLGVLHWAQELTDPFGCDESDIPLDEFVRQAVRAVENNLPRFARGALSLVDEFGN